ncbi:hypothetical protein [Haliscomenobacter sp.]|uniref:hypothetical protein n=1 Tax=Haliscomenobacter sp. TaxID=2717303 RepID=UPI0033650C62
MKTLIAIVTLLLFVTTLSFGQISIRVFNYHPTGEFGFVMSPLTSLELGLQGRFSKRIERRWRANMSLVYLRMKPRLDVFPVAGFAVDGKGSRVIPGLQSFQKYNIAQFIFGYDYAIVHKEKFNFYAGLDLLGGAASVDYELVYPSWKDETYQGGGVMVGLRARLGVEYAISDHIGVCINTNRSGFYLREPAAKLWAIDYGLGVRYTFN